MSEELHEITFTLRRTRSDIEAAANGSIPVTPEYREACRKWLEAHPSVGLTRDQFDALPNGAHVQVGISEQFMIRGGLLWKNYYDDGDKMYGRRAYKDDLRDMFVISLPDPPNPADVDIFRDNSGHYWGRIPEHDDRWINIDVPTRQSTILTDSLLKHRGPLTPMLPGTPLGGEA